MRDGRFGVSTSEMSFKRVDEFMYCDGDSCVHSDGHSGGSWPSIEGFGSFLGKTRFGVLNSEMSFKRVDGFLYGDGDGGVHSDGHSGGSRPFFAPFFGQGKAKMGS